MTAAGRRARALLALVAPLVLAPVTACGADPGGEGEAGMGLPQQLEGETYPGERSTVVGEVVLADNGCFLLDVDGEPRLVIWPAGSEHDGDGLLVPGGRRATDGTRVEGSGTVMGTSRLPGGPDGYWAHVLGFCAPDAADVVVLDEAVVTGG